jgi:hypothetical protein
VDADDEGAGVEGEEVVVEAVVEALELAGEVVVVVVVVVVVSLPDPCAGGEEVVVAPEVVVVSSGCAFGVPEASAPSAPPVRGPPRPAAVSPPPANADSIARRRRRRGLFIGGPSGPCCSWRSIVVVAWTAPRSYPGHGPAPFSSHIGTQARIAKGFVTPA